MRPIRLVLTAGAAAACLASAVLATGTAGASELATGHAGPPAGVVPATASSHAGAAGAGRSPNLVYHGGPVMAETTSVTPIFWGNWGSPGDKVDGLLAFYNGVGGSHYMGTNTEYADSIGAYVSGAVTLAGVAYDTSAAPSRAPQTSAILNEVAKTITNPVANGYYPVYVDTPRGHAGYCAWHSSGTANGVVVQFAFFFNLDGDPGCDPQSSATYSQGLAALGNVSGHELSEMLTDRHLDAWYDSSGAENADKCAWTFGSNLLTFGGKSWKIQGNWSNKAYNLHQGYGGNRGCIDGTNK